MKKSLKIVYTALFTALIFVATIVIQIPSLMDGYINLGDCFVLLSAWILGPYGIFASAIGSGLADILTGYGFYAPATIIIKGTMALIAFYASKNNKYNGKLNLNIIISAVFAEIVMVIGYFLYANIILGNGLSAFATIPGNLIQGLAGIVSSVIIYNIVIKFKIFK